MENKMFEEFNNVSKSQWIEQLEKELKGKKLEDLLIKNDLIEELVLPSFFHQEDIQVIAEIAGKAPYKRGFYSELNDWSIIGEITVKNEEKANKEAFELFNLGYSALSFDLREKKEINFKNLFKEIEFQYIKLNLIIENTELISELKAYFENKVFQEITFSYNPLCKDSKIEKSNLIDFDRGLTRNFEVDAYSIQQAGANCSQELAFALSLGHEYLSQQIEAGRAVDEALVNIHFSMGVGSNFFLEIAKFRALRVLWSKISRSYKPKHICNETALVSAKTGFLNKSLRDPYTNLLRQTTEVISAVLGGVSQINNQAYDALSDRVENDFTKRMASNISLILKEESYFDKVLDAVGGSYVIESLTEELANKAWSLFQENEKSPEILSDDFITNIKKTSTIRVDMLKSNKKTLIGVNKFLNPDKTELNWKLKQDNYFGLEQLILEKEI
jgi:methylmalonyl-CoA mutase